MLGLGLEGAYLASAHFGVGAALDAFYVDNLEYPEEDTLGRGAHCLLFAEGDLFPGWITPYARLGLGFGRYDRYLADRSLTKTHVDFVGQLSGGLALRGGPLAARLSASPTLFGNDFAMTYGIALGGRI
jgi:hypothetical protein